MVKSVDGQKTASALSSATQFTPTSHGAMRVASVKSDLATPATFATAKDKQPISAAQAQKLCDKLEKLCNYCARKNLSQNKFDRNRTEFHRIMREEVLVRNFSQNTEASNIRTKISGLVVLMSYLTESFIKETEIKAAFASIAKIRVSLQHPQETSQQQSASKASDVALFQTQRARMSVQSSQQALELVNNATKEFNKVIGKDNELARKLYDDVIGHLQAGFKRARLHESITKQLAQMQTELILNGLFFDRAHKGFIPHLNDSAIEALPKQQMSHLIEHLFTIVAETIDNEVNAKSIYHQAMNYIKKRYPVWPQNAPLEIQEMHSDINVFAKLAGVTFDDGLQS